MADDTQISKELLETILKTLVAFPGDVKVTRSIDSIGAILRARVHHEDMGAIIGKRGQTVEAIKLIVKAAGLRHGSRISVKIEEPSRPERNESTRSTS